MRQRAHMESLPLVDTFTTPYEVWEERPATFEEMVSNGHPGDVKVALIEKISDAYAAAAYIARVGIDNGLGTSSRRLWTIVPPTRIGRRQCPTRPH